jgi:hypothetical protein
MLVESIIVGSIEMCFVITCSLIVENNNVELICE